MKSLVPQTQALCAKIIYSGVDFSTEGGSHSCLYVTRGENKKEEELLVILSLCNSFSQYGSSEKLVVPFDVAEESDMVPTFY